MLSLREGFDEKNLVQNSTEGRMLLNEETV